MKLRLTCKEKSNNNKWVIGLVCSFFFFLGIYLGWQNVPGFLKANFLLIKDSSILPSLLEKNELDTLQLNIAFKNMKKIQDKRKEAIENERLVSTNDDFVKAEISLNGKKKHNLRT